MNWKSVCCTALLCVVAALTQRDLCSQTPDAREQLLSLAKANSLDIEGIKPWHLRMTFQLYDLAGKPSDTGTIEEWWVSPKERRLEIKSSSYNLTIPWKSDSSAPARNRESYLVNQLLDQIVHPIPDYKDFSGLSVKEQSRKFGKTELSCISVGRSDIKYSASSPAPQFCFDPGTTLLRAHLDIAWFGAVRNNMVTFRGITLGQDNTLAYSGRTAITGHLERLQGFQPDASIVLSKSTADIPAKIPGVVLARKLLKKETPEYPVYARQNHISGTVVLCATITKQGTIDALDVVSTPDGGLSASALDAVKRWKYQPYILDGAPTEVDATITVNYAITGISSSL